MLKICTSSMLICAVALLFISCDGNNIKFNANKSTITQENGKNLYRLTIASDSVEDFYLIELKPGNTPKRQISLFEIDTNYIVTNWHGTQVKKITLLPNRIYTIENRSDGDCSPGYATFKTDSFGKSVPNISKNQQILVKQDSQR